MQDGDILSAKEARYIEALEELKERVAEAAFQGRLGPSRDVLVPVLERCEKLAPEN